MCSVGLGLEGGVTEVTTDRVEKQVNRMGETGSRGKEGMMPAGKMTCFWWDTYAYFAFSSLCWRVLQAVGRVGTNWLNDTRMPDFCKIVDG